MSAADAVPVVLGLVGGTAVGMWSLGDKLRSIAHDHAVKRLETEELDHDATRKELVAAKREIIRLKSQLPPGSTEA